MLSIKKSTKGKVTAVKMAEAEVLKRQEASTVNPVPTEPPPPYQPSYGTADAVPPSYEQAQGDDTPPPSYDDIFGEMQRAKTESSGVLEFFKKLLVIILSTVGCTICVGIVLAVPISMIVIGARYFHECPRERYIPIYLIVAGSFGVVKNMSNMLQRCKNRQDGNEEDNARTNPLDSTLSCFLVIWFIAGNVWIYRIYNDFSTDPADTAQYCHPTLYYFAFWITTSTYILIGTICCCIVCAGTLASLSGLGSNPNDSAT